jgi:hypothetical protein
MTDEKLIDIPDMGISLPQSQAEELLEMFASNGWQVIREIWRQEKAGVVEAGMSFAHDEQYRTLARGAYHKLLDLECIEGNIRQSYNVAIGLAKPEE